MYTEEEKKQLIDLAKQSIAYGLEQDEVMDVDVDDYNDNLREKRASFVTLEIDGQLRGCIGSLVAHRPLVDDVVQNAYHAAFGDPRFPALTKDELEQIDIHISVLNKPESMSFQSEEDLLNQLRVGVDGLILSEGAYHATFLPSVWEQLPDPEQFLQHLKIKAGLDAHYWSDSIKVQSYAVESFGMVK